MTGFHSAAVRLDTTAFVLTVAVVAVLAVVLVPWRWDDWGLRRTGRTASVLLAVAAVVFASGAVVNHLGSFYPTLGSLLGTSGNPGEGTEVDAGVDGADLPAISGRARARAATGAGTEVHTVLNGPRSGLRRDVDIYLPAAYSDPSMAAVRFPVVEWFAGWPGEPRELVAPGQFGLPAMLDQAISGHRLPPTVVVFPDTNGEPRMSQDRECIDAAGGVADETFLADDVHTWVLKTLRVRDDRAAWALAGWSSGGYCALNLTVRHPRWYATAASQSGYDVAPEDLVSGALFAGRDDLRQANDVSVTLRQHPDPVALLATAGTDEHDECTAIERMRAAVTPPATLTTLLFPGGGHNADSVRAQLPAVVNWLGTQLPGPLGPSPAPDAQRVGSAELPGWTLPDPDASKPAASSGTSPDVH